MTNWRAGAGTASSTENKTNSATDDDDRDSYIESKDDTGHSATGAVATPAAGNAPGDRGQRAPPEPIDSRRTVLVSDSHNGSFTVGR